MANWSSLILTNKGKILRSKVEAGQTKLTLTKIKLGDGVISTGQTLEGLLDLVSPKQIVGINSVSAKDSLCTVTGIITNVGLQAGYNLKELGLFATDPDVGEILYAVTTDSSYDYLPAEGGATVVSEEFSLNIGISNLANVTAVVDMNGLLTVSSAATLFNEKMSDHNTDPNAHSNLGINLRKNSKTYVVGDVAYSLNLPTWARLDCIQGGTTASTEPTWGNVTAGQVFADGTVQWRIADVKSSGDSVGSIKPWLVKSIPAGWLDISTGAMVNRGTYPELWAWVQANAPLISEADWQTQANAQSSVGAFSTGDGSTTFRLPRIVDYVRGGILADVGKWQGDAIRNITGTSTQSFGGHANVYTGALAGTNNITGSAPTAGYNGTNFKFDASLVVPTADENRPKTVKMVYCIKAFGSPTNQGLIDITALANEVAGKENKHAYIRLWDEKTSGTVGGTFTSGAWRTRDLNQKQVVGMSVDAVTIASNQFTLPAGTYEIEASVPAYSVDGHKGRLQNITDGNTVLLGTSERSSTSASPYEQTRSIISGSFTITAQKTFEIQHYAISSNSSTGYGYATSISGLAEIYTQIIIRKVG